MVLTYLEKQLEYRNRVGTAFCSIMLGFGCKVIANDSLKSKTLLQKEYNMSL
jgi:hypothetical protein